MSVHIVNDGPVTIEVDSSSTLTSLLPSLPSFLSLSFFVTRLSLCFFPILLCYRPRFHQGNSERVAKQTPLREERLLLFVILVCCCDWRRRNRKEIRRTENKQSQVEAKQTFFLGPHFLFIIIIFFFFEIEAIFHIFFFFFLINNNFFFFLLLRIDLRTLSFFLDNNLLIFDKRQRQRRLVMMCARFLFHFVRQFFCNLFYLYNYSTLCPSFGHSASSSPPASSSCCFASAEVVCACEPSASVVVFRLRFLVRFRCKPKPKRQHS
jgi:hypothetical protein